MKSEGFGEVAEKLRRSTVQVIGGNRSSGSGTIWTGGTIITNAHVVRDPTAQVELWDGRTLQAEVIRRDDRADLAQLKLDAADLPPIAWRESAAVRPGELVIAVGNPLGFIGALTTGVVHLTGAIRGLGKRLWVQAAIRLAPGNSGGPLADAAGRVVGINTMVVSGGLALAVPSNTVIDFLKRGRRPTLGVVVQTVAEGLLLMEVNSHSAAEKASLLIGDVLISANGRGLESVDDLGDEIDGSAGNILKLRFLRGDRHREREVSVPLSESREAA